MEEIIHKVAQQAFNMTLLLILLIPVVLYIFAIRPMEQEKLKRKKARK
jgi:hypothetical protein